MRTRSKLILAALTATLLMGLAVSSASAGRLSTSNRFFRITWANVNFFDSAGIAEVLCPLTLEGSFHSATLRKVAGALLGAVTRGIVKGESCTGGRATVLQESLPWHVTYESFRGTLPNITSVELLLRRYAFRISVVILGFTVNCLYRDLGGANENLMGSIERNTATGAMTTLTPDQTRQAGRWEGSASCPAEGGFRNTGQVFLLGSSTTRISVTLI